MKAIVHHDYGSPDVLECEEVQKPTAGDDEVLVKVRAASVNPADWHTLRADPFLIRLMGDGFLSPNGTYVLIGGSASSDTGCLLIYSRSDRWRRKK